MTIKELEKRSGLPRTAIRFYEQQGLITPQRRENNYRDYSEEDARTLEKVKLLRQLSLDLEAIRTLKEGSLSLAQAGGACDALLSIPFQGAGAENQVEGPGGITVTLEVTQCEGYQASPYFGDYSILLQEKPGAGTLSFHITLEMP